MLVSDGKAGVSPPLWQFRTPLRSPECDSKAWGLRTGSENKKGGAGLGRRTNPPALSVRVHLYAQRVDGSVHDGPGAPPDLRVGRDVDQDGLSVLPEAVHDVGSEL